MAKKKKVEVQNSEIAIPDETRGLRLRCWAIFILILVIFLIPLPHTRTADGQLQPVFDGHFLLIKSQSDSWNDMARIATVESLAERGTMAIDHSKWGWFTGDKVLLREHFYSTKPPLLSAVGAATYYVLREAVRLTTGVELTYRKNEDIIYPWVTFTTSVLAFALLMVYFYRALYLVNLSGSHRMWIFWALAIGSLYPAYTTVLNNHTVAGSWVFISFYYVFRYRMGGSIKWWEAVFAGIALAFAGVNDYTGALPFLPVFFLLLVMKDFETSGLWPIRISQKGAVTIWTAVLVSAVLFAAMRIGPRGTAILMFGPLVIGLVLAIFLALKRKPVTLLFYLGMLIPIVVHLFLNSRVTGNWMPTYIQTDVYIAVPPGYFGEVLSPEESGFLNTSRWVYIGNALFGTRGVFLYTPAIMVGLWYAVGTVFAKGDRLRFEALALVLVVLAGWGYVLLFASPNFGGTSYGYRYALASTPMLIFFCHRVFTGKGSIIGGAIFRNSVVWGAIVGLTALPYPWGIFWHLPRTVCSFVENLQYIAFNTISYFIRMSAG